MNIDLISGILQTEMTTFHWVWKWEDRWLTWSIVNDVVEGVGYITYRMGIVIVSYISLQNEVKLFQSWELWCFVTAQLHVMYIKH